MWTKDDDMMVASIEDEIQTVIDASEWELSEVAGLKPKEKVNLEMGIKLHLKQIDWLRSLKQRIQENELD